MLLIGESRFGVSCDFKVLAVAEIAFDNLCVIENEAAMTNPLLRGLVDLLRPSVHGPPCVSPHRDHASGPPDLATISNAATAA
jgi:hypothetical protein